MAAPTVLLGSLGLGSLLGLLAALLGLLLDLLGGVDRGGFLSEGHSGESEESEEGELLHDIDP